MPPPPPPPPLPAARRARRSTKHRPPTPRAEIHFFGDKTFVGGNDYEIFEHPRTVGHAIADANPLTTLKKLSELFGVDCPASLSPPGSH
jgi:hypothetical protein